MSTNTTEIDVAGGALSSIYRSPLRYPGGKQKAIAQIAAMLPRACGEFREPMVGGGSVYFHARSVGFAQSYWINDQFRELVAFWQTVQNPALCSRLMSELEELRSSFSAGSSESADNSAATKEFYLRARKERPRSAYRQALLFFFFNRVTFSGTTRAGGFSSSASVARFTASSIARLSAMPAALSGTRITNEDFESVLLAPGDDVFAFIDPPYFTAQKLYGRDGSLHSFDHERLAAVLRRLSARLRFLITYDDCQEIRALYASWATITPWRLQYGMNNCGKGNLSKIGAELFIKNY